MASSSTTADWQRDGVRIVRSGQPPYVPHQEINASPEEPLECVVRTGQDAVVVNLDIASVEAPEEVHWVDSGHPRG